MQRRCFTCFAPYRSIFISYIQDLYPPKGTQGGPIVFYLYIILPMQKCNIWKDEQTTEREINDKNCVKYGQCLIWCDTQKSSTHVIWKQNGLKWDLK